MKKQLADSAILGYQQNRGKRDHGLTSIMDELLASPPTIKAKAVPAMAIEADKKLRASAFVTENPARTRIPKSPTCEYGRQNC
jgi:hypothetical protein